MADNEITFAMDLEGGLKEHADADADALERLKGGIQEGTEQLRAMQRAYSVLSKSATANADTVKELKDRITASKAALTSKTESLVKMKGAFDKTPKPVKEVQESVKKLVETTAKLPKPTKDTAAGLKGMHVAAGMAVAGLTALAAGMATLAAATVAAAGALALYGLRQADARRNDALQLEGLSKWRNYWLEMVTGQRRAADSASFLQQNIDRVAAASPLARTRISEMTSELYKAGLRGGRLQQALEGLAVTEAAQGQEAGAMFKARVLGATLYGTSIKKLSDDAKARLGGVVKAQMLSLGVQQQKLKESISHLFDGLKIERLLEGLSKITELFSTSTASGRALKTILEVTLQPLFDSAGRGAPLLKRFFQGIIIAALQLTIVVLKARNMMRDAFGGSKLLKDLDLQRTALYLGVGAFGALATVVGVTVGALAAMAGITAAVAYGIYQLVEPFVAVMMKGGELAAWVIKTDWLVLGSTITGGIASGIKAGAGAVMQAMRDMGSDAIKAFKAKLGIASPSKVAEQVTYAVPQGSERALNRGRSMVKQAATRLGEATEQGLRAGGAAGGGGAGASSVAAAAPMMLGGGAAPRAAAPAPAPITVTFGDVIVPGGAGQSPEALKAMMSEVVSEVLGRFAIQMGARA
jgi:hypothetical protein